MLLACRRDNHRMAHRSVHSLAFRIGDKQSREVLCQTGHCPWTHPRAVTTAACRLSGNVGTGPGERAEGNDSPGKDCRNHTF